MKQILVPTDFSETARDAYLYARQLAERFGSSLRVVHAYTGSFTAHEPYMVQPATGYHEVLEQRLQKFVEDTGEGGVATKVKVTYEAIMTLAPAGEVVIQSKEADLIVMGTTGEHDAIDKFLGSVSTGVAQRAHCPVLLIPKKAEFKDLKKMVYASNWESIDDDWVREAGRWAAFFGARIDFVHVNEDYELKDYEKLEEELFEDLFEESIPEFSFTIAQIYGDSPLHAIARYAEQNEADMIVTVNRQKGFFANLFRKSLTKELALNTKVPMLIFHYDD